MKSTAIILAGGSGKRMGADVPKQYIAVNGKPILYYTIRAFQESVADEIVLVVSDEYREYVKKEIVEKYKFTKVTKYVTGGKERYDSVYNALKSIEDTGYVAVHDGARPFVTSAIIEKSFEDAKVHRACVAGVPSKDTVKICDEKGFCVNTPNRKNVWIVQTPQTFEYDLIFEAYKKQQAAKDDTITDDAMVVEKYTDVKVHIFESEYTNTKITTADDMNMAKMLLL